MSVYSSLPLPMLFASWGRRWGVNSRFPRTEVGYGLTALPSLLHLPLSPLHPLSACCLSGSNVPTPVQAFFILGLSRSKQHKVNKTRKEASQVRWKRKLGSHNKGVWAELEQAVSLSKSKTLGLRLAQPVSHWVWGEGAPGWHPQWIQAQGVSLGRQQGPLVPCLMYPIKRV